MDITSDLNSRSSYVYGRLRNLTLIQSHKNESLVKEICHILLHQTYRSFTTFILVTSYDHVGDSFVWIFVLYSSIVLPSRVLRRPESIIQCVRAKLMTLSWFTYDTIIEIQFSRNYLLVAVLIWSLSQVDDIVSVYLWHNLKFNFLGTICL